MSSNTFSFYKTSISLVATLLTLTPMMGSGALGTLANEPLFLSGTVKPNITLVIDDSASMDAETIFDAGNGYLLWRTDTQTFVDNAGAVNHGSNGAEEESSSVWKKYAYLFPNGTGPDTGRRVMGDNHYAVPPLPQYGFARSSDYNKAYYNPNITYTPWPSTSSATYSDITATKAPSDPIHTTNSDSFFDLTTTAGSGTNPTGYISTDQHYNFFMYPGMVIPKGINYDGSELSEDVFLTTGGTHRIEYYPATYYKKTTTGEYTVVKREVNSSTGEITNTTLTGTCNAPQLDHYPAFHSNPSSLSGVDALGPDGACLTKVKISAAATEMQNFANWFSYYRRRHLGLRNAVGSAFKDITGVRVAIIEITDNDASVDMTDIDTGRDTFLTSVYKIDGSGTINSRASVLTSTPNRTGLDNAGKNYQRTGTGVPVQYKCQKNFAIQFTDGLTNDIKTFSTIGNADNGKGVPYQDAYSYTLGDIAMYYYTNKLRTDLDAGKVPVPAQCSLTDPDPMLDCNKDLHMNTLTMVLGVRGTIFGNTLNGKPYYKVADAYTNPPAWPNVTVTDKEFDPIQVDDLYHAAVNGRGEIFAANTPQELADKMEEAVSDVTSSIGSAAAVTFNTSQLSTSSNVYLALFNSSNWTGDLLSYGINPENGQVYEKATWSAAKKLDAQTVSSRIIYTYNNGGVPFEWGSLSDAQKNDLHTTPPALPTGVEADTFAKAKLNFLRGDRSNEGKKGYFRSRGGVLGDIVHSAPVYVGPAALNLAADTDYQTYASSVKNRAGVLYVGANDGMLHGFVASTGQEILAYIPSNLFSTASGQGLHYLADPAYQHRFYVDLEPVVFDTQLTISGVATWRTLLIGGERAGGQGYFALDVTDPTEFTAAKASSIVKWEFTSTDDADLGYTFSPPVVAKMEDGKWAAIFGNGYNNTGSGTAKLFVVYVDGRGLDGVWTSGTDYLEIDTGAGSSTNLNGLSPPALIDADGNGKVDRIYAGDLKGNMWAFDVSSTTNSNWKVAYSTSGVNQPLFTAQSNQSITTEPLVVKHPSVGDTTGASSNKPNVLVLFGTGQYLVTGDKISSSIQSVYGVWDDGAATAKPHTLSLLVQQTITTGKISSSTGYFVKDDTGNLRLITDNSVPYDDNNVSKRKYGWYINLPVGGSSGGSEIPAERVVVSGSVRGKNLFINTMIPSDKACEYGGSGWLLSIDFSNGGSPDTTPFDLNKDSSVDKKDLVSKDNNTTASAVGQSVQGIPARSSFLSNYQYTPTSSTTQGDEINIREVEGLDANVAGRLSWRELWNR